MRLLLIKTTPQESPSISQKLSMIWNEEIGVHIPYEEEDVIYILDNKEKEGIAGFCVINSNFVKCLYVTETLRRKGIGKRLIMYLIEIYGELVLEIMMDYYYIDISTGSPVIIKETNNSVLSFYESFCKVSLNEHGQYIVRL